MENVYFQYKLYIHTSRQNQCEADISAQITNNATCFPGDIKLNCVPTKRSLLEQMYFPVFRDRKSRF